MSQTCAASGKTFELHDSELAFIENVSPVFAGNARFLKGDVFFSVAFDSEVANNLSKKGELSLRYSHLNRPIMKCGYRGVWNVQVNISPAMRRNAFENFIIC